MLSFIIGLILGGVVGLVLGAVFLFLIIVVGFVEMVDKK